MVQYLITYSVKSDCETQHYNWLCNDGMNYFKGQPGFKELRAYSTLVGSGPDWVLEVDFDSADNLMRSLESDDAKRILEEFEHLVTNLSTKILVPTSIPVGPEAKAGVGAGI